MTRTQVDDSWSIEDRRRHWDLKKREMLFTLPRMLHFLANAVEHIRKTDPHVKLYQERGGYILISPKCDVEWLKIEFYTDDQFLITATSEFDEIQ